MGDVSILFRNSKTKFNHEQLNENKILYKKEINKPFVNYTFKMANNNKIMYYILYNNFIIGNEEFYMKWYSKNNTLTQNQKDDYMQLQFNRFGK